MIVLNQGKELVRVESWDDIVGRPGFNGNLNPAEHTLSGILGQYAFGDRIRCGLSDCHTPHGRGYLVVTKSGVETNIGKDCGKNYFGVDFETMATQFDRDMRDKQARERLWDFTFKLDELKQCIKALRTGERGADWVYKNSRPLLESGKGVPGVVIRRIADLLRTGENALTTEREPTEREIDLARVQGGRPPRVIVEKVADIRGLEALQSQNDLRQILVVDLEEGIKEFEQLNVDKMKSTELSRWSKWVGSIEHKLDSATAAISSGQVLLTPANLQPFAILIPKFEGPKSFQAYLKTLA